jgi:hypothetical protein
MRITQKLVKTLIPRRLLSEQRRPDEQRAIVIHNRDCVTLTSDIDSYKPHPPLTSWLI